jgi:hypothetical protein
MNVRNAKNRRLKLVGKAKQTIIGCLILGSLLICLTAAPQTYTQISDVELVAKVKPTPEKVLDETSAAELIEELKESLAEEIEDEDTINEIVEKWESQKLIGKTRKQALKILFEDVKAVVEDKEITDNLWETWSSDRNEDSTEGVSFSLTKELKSKLGGVEEDNFKLYTGLPGQQYESEKGSYKGQSYTIYKDTKDPNLTTKVAAVNKAVRLIIDTKLNIPKDLRVYCTSRWEAVNIAFKRDRNWNPTAIVILGPKALDKMSYTSISQSGLNGLDRPTITIIHEIGHIIHERFYGDPFWELLKGNAPANLAGKVSQYANTGKKEFVAEVFTGSILGMKFDADVMAEYKKLGGPLLP